MNKYLKISLASLALSILFVFLLSSVNEWSYLKDALKIAVSDISYYGMILTALVSAITGLVAAYHALKSGDNWWHVITIYAAANILIVLGSIFVFFTT